MSINCQIVKQKHHINIYFFIFNIYLNIGTNLLISMLFFIYKPYTYIMNIYFITLLYWMIILKIIYI